jgi:hypothetical protein
MKQYIVRYHINLQNIDEMTMWLIEWKIAWQDWMEDYKINNSSDNVIDWMRSNMCDDVFGWMKQYMTKRRCDCLNETIYDKKKMWLLEWNNTQLKGSLQNW